MYFLVIWINLSQSSEERVHYFFYYYFQPSQTYYNSCVMRHKEIKAITGRKYIPLIFEQNDKIMIKMNLTFRSHGNCQQPTSCRRTLSSTVKSRHKKIYFQHTTEAFDDKDNYCLFEDEDFFSFFFFRSTLHDRQPLGNIAFSGFEDFYPLLWTASPSLPAHTNLSWLPTRSKSASVFF